MPKRENNANAKGIYEFQLYIPIHSKVKIMFARGVIGAEHP